MPSQTVIGGENLTWYYPKAALRGAPFMLKSMVKPDAVTIMTMARKVAAPDKVASCWRRILSWPSRTLLTYHDVPGSGFVGDGRAALAARSIAAASSGSRALRGAREPILRQLRAAALLGAEAHAAGVAADPAATSSTAWSLHET